MVITIQQFIKDLKSEHMDHYVPLYEGKAYTLAVYIDDNGFRNNVQEKEFADWCRENCEGECVVHNECWVIFELETDAMAFRLRWE